ncbi:hypothetical protein BH10PAT3_BH10PAT3_0510 [soil metagenome]
MVKKIKLSQSGFAHIEIVVVIIVIGLILGVGYMVMGKSKIDKPAGSKTNLTTSQIAADEVKRSGSSQTDSAQKPILRNLLGISFGPYNKTAGTSGDFIFSQSAAEQQAPESNMIYFPFAQKTCIAGTCKVQTEMTLGGLKNGTPVKAAASGKVVSFTNEGPDYSFVTVSDDYPDYAVGYDHLAAPSIKEGDNIKADQIIGKAAPYGDGKFSRIEIFIKKGKSDAGKTVKVCPIDYLDASAKSTVVTQLKQFFTDWNGFTGKDVYSLATMSTPGCIETQTVE